MFSFLKCFSQGVVVYANTDMLYYIGITGKHPRNALIRRLVCQGFVSVNMKKMILAKSRTSDFENCFQY